MRNNINWQKYLIIALVFIAVACNNYGAGVSSKPTSISLSHNEIDLGTVKTNAAYERTFTITNTGNAPLTIYRIATSCGCTEVEWSRKPVKPQKTKTIKIKYQDKYPGYIHKTVTIYGNIDKSVVVKIKGELVE